MIEIPGDNHKTTDLQTPAPPGMREAIPDASLASRELKVFGGVEVARNRFLPAVYETSVYEGHFITLHLNGPVPGTAQFDGRKLEYVEAEGDVMVVPAGIPGWQAPRGPSEDLNVLLGDGFFRRAAVEAGADPDRVEVLNQFCVRDEQIERILLSFLPELETGGMSGELYAESLAQALAVHLLREHSSLANRARRKVARELAYGLSERQLKQATDYIGDNLASDLTLAEVSGAVNMSPYHFSRLFKESTGLPPYQYVIQRRVEKAKTLLESTELSAGEVALAVGFATHSHFASQFKRLTGASPSALRRERFS